MQRRFVWVVNTGETLYLAATRLGIHPFRVSFFADFQGRVDEYFNEVIFAHHVAHFVSERSIRTYRRAQNDTTVTRDLSRDEADAPDIGVPVFLAEAEFFREMGPHYIAIQHRLVTTALQQEHRQDVGRGRFAGAAQTREPDAHALPMPGRVTLRQDLGDLRPRKPCRQGLTIVQVILAHLGARDGGRARSRLNLRAHLVAAFFREVYQFQEGDNPHFQLLAEALNQLLGVVWAIKGLVRGVHPGTGVGAPDDKVVGSKIAANQGMPQCL